MGISQYIKEIGRGARGAKPLTREQAADLFGQVLDGTVTDLEIGGFCLAMRIKGETPEEMAGFLDATHARLNRFPPPAARWSCCPATTARASCRCSRPAGAAAGARRPAGAGARQRERNEPRAGVERAGRLDLPALTAIRPMANGEAAFAPTELLNPALKRLLDVRRVVGPAQPGPQRGQADAARRRRLRGGRELHAPRIRHAPWARPSSSRAPRPCSRAASKARWCPTRAAPRRSTASCAANAPSCRRSSRHAGEVPGLPKEIDVAPTVPTTRAACWRASFRCPARSRTQVRHITQLASHA
jgi:hypothetical protein